MWQQPHNAEKMNRFIFVLLLLLASSCIPLPMSCKKVGRVPPCNGCNRKRACELKSKPIIAPGPSCLEVDQQPRCRDCENPGASKRICAHLKAQNKAQDREILAPSMGKRQTRERDFYVPSEKPRIGEHSRHTTLPQSSSGDKPEEFFNQTMGVALQTLTKSLRAAHDLLHQKDQSLLQKDGQLTQLSTKLHEETRFLTGSSIFLFWSVEMVTNSVLGV